MTVKELREALSRFPDDLPVVARSDGEGERDAWGVSDGVQWREGGWPWQPGEGAGAVEMRLVAVIRTNSYGG